MEGRSSSKTVLFLFNQRHQAPKLMTQLIPFLFSCTLFGPPPPDLKCLLVSPRCEVRHPERIKEKKQNCLAKTQVVRMGCIVSLSWSHKGQLCGCCSPLFSRLLAVHTCFLLLAKVRICIFEEPKTSKVFSRFKSNRPQKKAR